MLQKKHNEIITISFNTWFLLNICLMSNNVQYTCLKIAILKDMIIVFDFIRQLLSI